MKSEVRIFLAGDSTVQSFDEDSRPQAGWGEKLCAAMSGIEPEVSRPQDVPFDQVWRYVVPGLTVENHAKFARSSRTFWEEGRLDCLEQRLRPGDFLFMQFSHNDANREKKERYVPAEEFESWLLRYVDVCRKRRAACVLVTPIVMRDFDALGHLHFSFPEYRQVMLKMAEKGIAPVLDLGAVTREYCEQLGPEKTKEIFLWAEQGEYPCGKYCGGVEDNAHLQEKGAEVFAGLLVREILASGEEALAPLKKYLEEKENCRC